MQRMVGEEGCTASVLLLGERRTGIITLVVERALQTLCARNNLGTSSFAPAAPTLGGAGPSTSSAALPASDPTATTAAAPGDVDKLVGVVRISGLLHVDERVVFQEIARQLCVEFEQLFAKSATYDENLAFLRTMLQALHRCMKTVVFVVDELDAFTRKGKQMLLYNLLDTLAHAKVQACVIGVSCMQDVLDHMEKRVKSRFAAKRIVLTSPQDFAPRAAQAATSRAASSSSAATITPATPAVPFEETPSGVLQAMLQLPTATAAAAAAAAAAVAAAAAAGRAGPAAGKGVAGKSGPRQAGAADLAVQVGGCFAPGFVEQYNGQVVAAIRDPAVQKALLSAFNVRLRLCDLANIAQLALLEWTLSEQQQQQQQQQQAQQQQPGQQQQQQQGLAAAAASTPAPFAACHVLRAVQQHMGASSSQLDALASLSILQLFLAVAMWRLASKGAETVNFEMAYDEYRAAMQGGAGAGQRGDEQYKWSRPAALRAFQGLLLCGVAVQAGGGQSGERVAGRGAAFAGAELRAGRGALDAALKARGGACPDVLLRFFRMEV